MIKSRAICLSLLFALSSYTIDSEAKKNPKKVLKRMPTQAAAAKIKNIPRRMPAQAATPSAQKSNGSKRTAPKFDSAKTLSIEYGNPQWNQQSSQIDHATVIMRDRVTGSVAQIELQETEPDSSIFSGRFIVTWGSAESVKPEIYIPTKSIKNETDFANVRIQIADGKLPKKPFLLRKNDRREPVIEVFDTREQTEAALRNYTKKQSEQRQPKAPPKNTIAQSVLDAEQLAQLEKEKKKISQENQQQELERARLEQVEAQKQKDRLAKQNALSKRQREENIKQAALLAQEAMVHYREGKYKEAEPLFEKSINLNPENPEYFYNYGVTLYRNEKYNPSIVYLKRSQPKDALERDFYVGLNYYRLKDYTRSHQIFEQIRQKKHPMLSPSSAFYLGLNEFEQIQYEKAQIYFQEVLDTSQDPKMDEQAEQYIEKIQRLLQFARNKQKKFLGELSAGVQYDSNILLVSDSSADQSAASDIGDTRYSGGAGLMWRPVFEKEYEFGIKARGDLIYTSRPNFFQADPLLYSLTAPFIYKGQVLNKGAKIEVKPGYEVLYLDLNNDRVQDLTMYSVTADSLNTLIMSDTWFSSLNLKYRQDKFPNGATQDADKWTLNTNNIFFFNAKKTQGLSTDLSYVMNDAKGSSYKYNRFDIGANYLAPLPWEIQFIGGIVFYSADYVNDPTKRLDNNTTLSAVFSKPLLPWLSGVVMGNYTKNSSNITARSYSKYTAGTFLSANFQF